MKVIVDNYQAILGRPPSRGEMERLERIASAMGLRDNDALWFLLIVFEDYDRRYRRVPARIEDALTKAVSSLRDSADRETRAAAARAVESMARETARIGQEIAAKTAGRDRLRWLSIMAIVCTIALLVTGTGAYYAGHKTGAAVASDAAAWALSNEGRQARALAKTGSLPILSGCLGDGWRIETFEGRAVCRAEQNTGWYIP